LVAKRPFERQIKKMHKRFLSPVGILLTVAIIVVGAVPTPAQQIKLRPGAKMPEPKQVDPRFVAPDDAAAPPADAVTEESGLSWKRLSEALDPVVAGDPPGPNDSVSVRYTGWTTDGQLFDTTEERKKPRSFRVSGVIKGFELAVQKLRVGEEARFWIPEPIAYNGRAGKPAGMLVFDLQLVGVDRGPATPDHLDSPPDDATRNPSGLVWKQLSPGDDSSGSPGNEDTILVNYNSWTPEGRLLESTALTGTGQKYTLNLVIPAFTEAFTDMVVGESRRLWIPPELTELEGEAVHDEPIIFDVELLSFLSKPEAPLEVSSIPDDAERSQTGLAWRILKSAPEVADPQYPQPGDTVKAIYAGWTRDGNLFDAAYNHGTAGTFVLDDGMPLGWNEALLQMTPGEKRLYWIPEDIAYGGRSDRPKGMLVFEIELLSIEPASLDDDGATP
jgi:peptidylprolyl isomerase